jgi:hypothetical protein
MEIESVVILWRKVKGKVAVVNFLALAPNFGVYWI